MEDLVDLETDRLYHVVSDEFQIGMVAEMLDVLHTSREIVIQAKHTMTLIQ